MNRLRTILIAAVMTALPLSAGAAIVDFNTYSPIQQCQALISDGGLDFANHGSGCLGVWNNNPNGNGTNGLILGFTGFATITRTGGGAFDLNSFDLGISWYEPATTSNVTVTAHLNVGGTTVQVLNLIQALQTYNLGLANVVSVDVSALSTAGGYWLMDNVNYDDVAVPEPATLGLLAVGMVASFRRSRR